jgi:calcineurin-like phosphoesterase family protein
MPEIFTSVRPLMEIKIQGNTVVLCHYAMRTWNKSHYNSWQLYGHSHGGLAPWGKQHDVGLDANKMCLLGEEYIVKIMEAKGNNSNYLCHHAE